MTEQTAQKILIISDTHGRKDRIEDVIKQVGRYDLLIHAGDHADDVLSRVPKAVAVCGNCDAVGSSVVELEHTSAWDQDLDPARAHRTCENIAVAFDVQGRRTECASGDLRAYAHTGFDGGRRARVSQSRIAVVSAWLYGMHVRHFATSTNRSRRSG